MARLQNRNWNLPGSENQSSFDWNTVKVAVLMDIRDELQRLNALLGCHNFTAIPTILRGIKTNTTKRKRVKGGR